MSVGVDAGNMPLIIADRVEWGAPARVRVERQAFMRQLEAWRTDWQSRDTGRYLAHYARAFRSDGIDLAAWSAHKRAVTAAKAWMEVALSDISVFRTPGHHEVMVVTFDQDYRSNSYAARKRQYWVHEADRWKIAYEAPVGRPVLALRAPTARPCDDWMTDRAAAATGWLCDRLQRHGQLRRWIEAAVHGRKAGGGALTFHRQEALSFSQSFS